MSTITHVAQRAGVSTATVSRYLRGRSVRAQERIREAITELDFTPSAAAQTLKSGITRSVGVVVPDVTNPFFAAVVKGAETASRQSDYNLFLYNSEDSLEREEKILSELSGRVDGIILAPVTEQDRAPVWARGAGLPVVFLDREIGDSDFDAVLVDNVGGGQQAASYLISLGHERIGIISGPLDTTPGRERHEGFTDALRQAEIPLRREYSQPGGFRQDGGYQATLRLLALEAPPTAIFVANNMMTIGALHALRDLHVHLPDELSIIGFDDHDLADLLAPPLTVIDRPMEEQGVLAMRLLLNRVAGIEDDRPRRIVLDTRVVARGSCGPPSSRAP